MDCSGLNKTKVKNCNPLSLLYLALEVQVAKVFSKLVLHFAYRRVCIREGECITAFNMPSGYYEYIVMSFAKKNAAVSST